VEILSAMSMILWRSSSSVSILDGNAKIISAVPMIPQKPSPQCQSHCFDHLRAVKTETVATTITEIIDFSAVSMKQVRWFPDTAEMFSGH
jgi:transposase